MDPRPDATPTVPDQSVELVETRLSHLIVAAVGIGLVAILGLAWWGYFVPYTSGGDSPITCGAVLTLPEGPDQEAMLDRYEAGCDAARADRRNTAILIGTGVVVLLAAASTWPSRRLLAGRAGRAADVADEPVDVDDEASELRRLGLLEGVRPPRSPAGSGSGPTDPPVDTPADAP